MKLKQSILAAAMLMAAALPMQAQAATATGTIAVSATVVAPSATVNVAGPLAFGTIVTGGATSTTTSIDVTVSAGVPYTLDYGNGAGWTANSPANNIGGNFEMNSANGATLEYSLYKDSAAGGQIITEANLFLAVTDYANEIGSGSVKTYVIYGKILAFYNTTAGIFTDTITATVTY